MAVGLTYSNHQENIDIIFCFFLVWIMCVLQQVEQHLGIKSVGRSQTRGNGNGLWYRLYRLQLVDKEQAQRCKTCVRHDASEYGRYTTNKNNKLSFQLLYYFYNDICHFLLYLLKLI